MAKTINPEIDIFQTLQQAERAYDKLSVGSLLYSPSTKCYFVDKRTITDPESAFYNWPKQYTVARAKGGTI